MWACLVFEKGSGLKNRFSGCTCLKVNVCFLCFSLLWLIFRNTLTTVHVRQSSLAWDWTQRLRSSGWSSSPVYETLTRRTACWIWTNLLWTNNALRQWRRVVFWKPRYMFSLYHKLWDKVSAVCVSQKIHDVWIHRWWILLTVHFYLRSQVLVPLGSGCGTNNAYL